MNSRTTHDTEGADRESQHGQHPKTLQIHRKGSITAKRLFRAVTAPLCDFIRRPKGDKEPPQAPDYSKMVLLTFVFNPVLGILMCYLHRHAKRVYHREFVQLAIEGKSLEQVQEGRWWNNVHTSDLWYISLIACCHFIIGISLVVTAVISLDSPAPPVAVSPKNCLIYRHDIHTMCTRKIETFHEYCLTKNIQYEKIKFPHGVCKPANDSDPTNGQGTNSLESGN